MCSVHVQYSVCMMNINQVDGTCNLFGIAGLIQNSVNSHLCLEKSKCSRVLLKIGGAYLVEHVSQKVSPDKMAVCSDSSSYSLIAIT